MVVRMGWRWRLGYGAGDGDWLALLIVSVLIKQGVAGNGS
jgi:hypothetical protein